jgi:putative SOS response-associated peptidase YedK
MGDHQKMCGRYITAQAAAFERALQLGKISWSFEISYNVAPTQQVPVVRFEEGENVGLMMRWGLIPFFAKGEAPKYSTINARIETVETAASYRGPWKRGQRCIQLAAGFYEWHLDESGRKAPFLIKLNDQDVFGFAGLWDRSFKADGSSVESVAHVTMPANDLMRKIHNTGGNPHRMPAILRKEDYGAWLHGSIDEARAALQPYPPDHMYAFEVSTRVNSSKNNGPELIEPAKTNVG